MVPYPRYQIATTIHTVMFKWLSSSYALSINQLVRQIILKKNVWPSKTLSFIYLIVWLVHVSNSMTYIMLVGLVQYNLVNRSTLHIH